MLADFWAAVSGIPGAHILTTVNLVFAGLSGAGAFGAAYFAWKARARPEPIFEVYHNEGGPWAGWITVRIWAANPSLATVEVTEIAVPPFSRSRLCWHNDATEEKTEWREAAFLDRDRGPKMQTRTVLKSTPPETGGRRELTFSGLIKPDKERRMKVDFFLSAGEKGGSPPKYLRVRYRYLDRRDRLRSSAARLR